MQRLYLNNIEIDLGPKRIAQTYQINDLAEIKDRNLHFTQKFNVPPSPANSKAMEYLGVIGSKSRKPYQQIPAKYVYDGIELMPTGYARVSKSQDGGYDINIYDGNASLYEVLKGKRINDLDYEDMNHALNGSTHLASLDHTSGYIYALGFFGFSNVVGLVNSERQVPSVFKHTLFDKILTQAGFTYDLSILSDSEFLREVVCPTKGYDVVGEETSESAEGSTSSSVISKNEYQLKDPEYEIEQFDLTGVSLVNISIQNGNTIQFDSAGLYKITTTFTYTMVTGNGLFKASLNGAQPSSYVSMIADGIEHIEVIEYYIQAEAGDTIRFFTDTWAIPGAANKFEIEYDADLSNVMKSVTGGQIVKFEEIMPDSSQIDFIKDVMQQYGLIFQADKNSSHYNFIRIEDLLNDRANAQDWSDKMIDNGAEEYAIGLYAQSNWMQYKYTDQEVIDTSFDGNLTADHLNLKDEKTLFTSIFTISEKAQTRNTHPIYGVDLWEEKVEQEGTVINNKEVQFRSFKLKYIDEAVTFQFGNIVGNYTRASNMPFLSLENMEFDYYIANHYSAFGRILDNQKKRSPRMLLKALDIYSLDFLRLKYIKQLGQYFYLNKVKNFIEGNTTIVELIQANELTVNQPPSQLGSKSFSLTHGNSKVLYLSDFMNTDPIYTDPEFDQPETIKILSGFGDDIIIKNNGIEITDSTPFEVATMMITIEDEGTDPLAHSNDFTFTIQSFNNENFSDEIGTISVSVSEEQNLQPTADAGNNLSMVYDSSSGPQNEVVNPDGSGSNDPNDDILTYLWTADQLPSSVVLSNSTSAICTLTGTGLTGVESGEIITMTLRVEDPSGLFDTDTMTVQIIDLGNIPI